MGEIKMRVEKREFMKLARKNRSLSELPIIDFIFVRNKFKDNVLMDNGLLQDLVFSKEKLLTSLFNILIVINTFVLYLYYQHDHNSAEPSPLWAILSYLTHISLNIVLAILLKIKYDSMSIVQKQNFSFILPISKLILNLIIYPMPWIDHISVDVSYDDGDYNNLSFPLKLNYLIVIPALLKNLFIIATKMMVYTYFFGPRSTRLKKLFSVDSLEELFAVRCMFREYPIKLVTTLFIAGFIFFSITFSIVESHVPIQTNPFSHLQNCFWFTFITITTVGYGDVKIRTHLGYFIGVVCMVWGTFIISCTLVVLINTLSLGSSELESLAALQRVDGDLQYNRLRKYYIRMSLWRLWRNYKYEQSNDQPWAERKMRKRLNRIRRSNKAINPTTNIALLAKLEFDKAIINIQYLYSNNAEIITFISNHMFSQELSHQNIATEKTLPDKSFMEETIQMPTNSALDLPIEEELSNMNEASQVKLQYLHVLKVEDLSSKDIHSNGEEQPSISPSS